eukprot:SAG22_NODE_60_length_23423_cov_8.445250_9_plen_276_part_00
MSAATAENDLLVGSGETAEDRLLADIRAQIRRTTAIGIAILAVMGITIVSLIAALTSSGAAAGPDSGQDTSPAAAAAAAAAAEAPVRGGSAWAGFNDLALYADASSALVGAHEMVSFSSASTTLLGPTGNPLAGHGLPEPEALCNCECQSASDFVYCYHTAKTTAGVSTFAFDPVDRRWVGEALRFLLPGSPGEDAGRGATAYVHRAVLPDGPGGDMLFTVSYVGDSDGTAGGGHHAATIVRGRTAPPSCSAAPLCDVQCSGSVQYERWRSDACG